MADNAVTPFAAGTAFATDDVGGIIHPRSKISIGIDGVAADLSDVRPMPIVGGFLPAGTDKSGTVTVGGTAQALAAANTSRRGLFGQNISSADLWINEVGGTAAPGAAGSYRIAAGESFSVSTSRAISIIGATTGQVFTAVEV